MSCSSSLIDVADPLILDTSVLINLHACKYGERILASIPNDVVVSEIVVGELEHETSRQNGEHRFLYDLVTGGVSPNRRNFRHRKFSPATIASRSMTSALPRKV
jgi:hypothetical protein